MKVRIRSRGQGVVRSVLLLDTAFMRLTMPDGLVPGLAGQGLTQVIAAFCDGQVADLLLAGDPAATAWIGPAGDDLAAAGAACWKAACSIRLRTARMRPWRGRPAPTPSCISGRPTWCKPGTPRSSGTSAGHATGWPPRLASH